MEQGGEGGTTTTTTSTATITTIEPVKSDGAVAEGGNTKTKGYASVKAEYRVEKSLPVNPAPVVKESTGEDGSQAPQQEAGGEEGEEEQGGGKGGKRNKRKGGMNKKRPRDAVQDAADQVCRVLASMGTCTFGNACRYSHDLADFMKRKEKDIGPMCPIYEVYGQCPAKITCRWATSHFDIEGGERLRAEADGGVKPIAKEINEFRKDLMWQLKKKQHEFQTPKGVRGDDFKYDLTPLPDKERKLVDFSNKVYIAPLTTVGNLPFRRVMKSLGADITCGEMALAFNLLQGQASEWALLRRHRCEDVFGIQVAGGHADQMMRCAELLSSEVKVDFVDLNLGCPLDLICDQGMGSSLMQRTLKLHDILKGMTKIMGHKTPLTIKMRTGWDEKRPMAHTLIGSIQKWKALEDCNIAAVMVHGRSRQQRYTKTADWDYISKVATSQDPEMPRIPIIGNGDIMSFTDFEAHKAAYAGILEPCAMLARGALIKPWLPTEIKEQRHWDISSRERLDILKQYVNFGLEHWGSDQRGVNNTRRFLLEWLSFLYRYVPVGLLEHVPQHINDKPEPFRGRDDLETLMASPFAHDWVVISEMLLGPTPEGFSFVPKHRANSYNAEG